MDLEKKQRRQSLKVIFSEAIMVLAVIVTVVILALIVSGYWLNSDFKVERQGMLQIYSAPTGATVEIDGKASSWLQRTNTSKVLSSGEHTIGLTREGYDSWSKTINISEGLLYRLHYPRLFLKDRLVEDMLDISGSVLATVSPNREQLLLTNNTTEWLTINLNNEKLEPKKLDIASFFSSVSLAEGADAGLFSGEILETSWDYDGTHVLFKVRSGENIEWVLLDVKNPKNTINLTQEFGDNFSQIEILDNSATNLLVVQNNNLKKIDVPGKLISAVLVEGVTDFDHYGNELVFSALNQPEEAGVTPDNENTESSEFGIAEQQKPYYVGYFKIGDHKLSRLAYTDSPAKVAISKFYDNDYITIIMDSTLSLYKKDDFEEILSEGLSFSPQDIKVGYEGEFVVAYSAKNLATLDMESTKIREWSIENESFGWIDPNMIYTVSDGELIVYDFDGLNRRSLVKNVSTHFPAIIVSDRWMYYFSDSRLMREWLIPR